MNKNNTFVISFFMLNLKSMEYIPAVRVRGSFGLAAYSLCSNRFFPGPMLARIG